MSLDIRNSRLPGRCRVAFVAVSLALLLQCLAPPGYMAGSLGNGWPVVLCPEGLPAGFLGHHDHHHHHGETSGEDRSLDGYCPLGGVLDATVGLSALPIAADQAAGSTPLFIYRSPGSLPRPYSYPVRGPPAPV